MSNEKYVGDVILGKTDVIDGIQVKSQDASKLILMRVLDKLQLNFCILR